MARVQSYSKGGGQAVEAVARRIEQISTIPVIAFQVMEIAGDPESGAADLNRAMESDASLSARVLRCVNSSAYAVRQKITNLQQAIAYLGIKQIRNLAVTAAVSELFKEDKTIGPYRRSALWQHLVSVGICARMIAQRLEMENFEDVFLAGLLHDIGIILEDQQIHGTFCEVAQSLQKDKTLAATERDLLGFDHTTLGEKIGELWGFPESVRASTRYHHMSTNYRGPQTDIVRCVEVANIICSLKRITSVGLNLVKFSRPAFSSLSLKQEDIASLNVELGDALAANASLFHV